MSYSSSAVFSHGVFDAPTLRAPTRVQVAQDFTKVFTSVLVGEMRKAMTGDGHGLLGTQGGATGDIYGAFADQALGAALAKSPAMRPLTKSILRELSTIGSAETGAKAADSSGVLGKAGPQPVAQEQDSGYVLAADSRGPVLLPPQPSLTGPLLPPPGANLEGQTNNG